MLIHLGEGDTAVEAPAEDGLWVPLDIVAAALELEVRDLEEESIGFCPSDDICVPVPQSALTTQKGVTAIRLQDLAASLGLAIASDTDHAVVLTGAVRTVSFAQLGAPLVAQLPNVHTGEVEPLGHPGKKTAIFAWASW
ncbi:MAG: hypothetical protein KY429_07795 [Actinobacteria bacterium]|nr:hypothetical protein [Actinomycetota bacterium]